MNGVTYDTGALLAAERGSHRMQALHRRAQERGVTPVVPAAVLAQAWRGGPQPLLSRLLAGCRIEALAESLARSASAALALAETSDVVDASVAVGAAARNDVVVTSDPEDILHIGSALGLRLEIETV